MYIEGAYWACSPPIRSTTIGREARLRSRSSWRARSARFRSRSVRVRPALTYAGYWRNAAVSGAAWPGVAGEDFDRTVKTPGAFSDSRPKNGREGAHNLLGDANRDRRGCLGGQERKGNESKVPLGLGPCRGFGARAAHGGVCAGPNA